MANAALFFIIVERELRLMMRRRNEYIHPLLFFLLVAMLFPLTTTLDLELLKRLAPGIIWLAAVLATLLTLNKLYESDQQDGSLEQFIISPFSLSIILLAKNFAYWLMISLPLILISPLLGLLFGLSAYAILILVCSLSIGTPILNLVGGTIAALTVALPGGGILLTLVLLPLYVPVLIFGSGSVTAAQLGLPVIGQLALLASFLVAALTFTPLVCAYVLRLGIVLEN